MGDSVFGSPLHTRSDGAQSIVADEPGTRVSQIIRANPHQLAHT
jgi:hypothetical protein